MNVLIMRENDGQLGTNHVKCGSVHQPQKWKYLGVI